MANHFHIFTASDAHIGFLEQCSSETLYDYCDGKRPAQDQQNLPFDWPTSPLKPIGPSNAINRNTDLYHWILNGTSEPVQGSGSIFQTWAVVNHSAIDLTGDGVLFALKADQLPELEALAAKVDQTSVQKAFSAWLAKKGKKVALDPEACQPFVEEFQEFAHQLRKAITNGQGLIWIPR
ncbi:MAG: hypothetical protein FWC42_02535 [Proteobacteria bacterium]|nr:hypothetical protein [Pseudomonadota bacterium]MCL2309141.1 hypothetical protein [Pseudomonadota bacterium]